MVIVYTGINMTTMLNCFQSRPLISFERIIALRRYNTQGFDCFYGRKKSLESLSTALSLQGLPPLLIISGLLEPKSSNESFGSRGTGIAGIKATECTTETDSKSTTTKFFFAIKINIRGWGLTKTGGRGCQRSCFLDAGLNLMWRLSPETLHFPRRLNYSNFRFTRIPPVEP